MKMLHILTIKLVNHFQRKVRCYRHKNINYKFDINKELLHHLVRMTPLTWGESDEKLHSILEKDMIFYNSRFRYNNR